MPTMLMSDLSPLSLQTIAALTTHAAQIPTAMSEYINLFIRKLNRILWIGTPSHWGPKEEAFGFEPRLSTYGSIAWCSGSVGLQL